MVFFFKFMRSFTWIAISIALASSRLWSRQEVECSKSIENWRSLRSNAPSTSVQLCLVSHFFSEDLYEILLDLWYLGNGCDLVCLGEQPLHVVPLFQFKSSSSESHSRDYFHIPHWINHRLFQEKSRRLRFIKQLLLLKFSFQLLHVCKPGASHAQPRVYTLHSSPRNYLERVVRNQWNETVKWTDLFCFYVSYSHSAYMFSRLQACLLPSLRTWRATMFRSRITTSLTRKCLRPLTAWPPTKLSTGTALQQALLIAS